MTDLVFNHIWNSIQTWVAGEWAGIWHKGVLYGAILVLVGLAYGSRFLTVIPLVGGLLSDLFAPLRKDLLWAAFGCVLILGGEYVGDRDARAACVAKTVVIDNIVTKDVAKVKKDKTTKDPWDNPNY